MVSEKTKSVTNAVVKSIQSSGINDSDLQDLLELAQIGIIDDGDRGWGLQVTDYVKKCKMAFYDNIQDACFEDDVFWDAMKIEAQNRVFDSYMLYLEKDRSPKDRFYLPKRKQFQKIQLVQSLQDALDDKIDILMFSLPPGTGKGELPTSKILTPTGFKTFGELSVGDRVIAGNGNVAHVVGIYPKPSMPIYNVIMDDGSNVVCSQDHIWHVQTRDDRKRNVDKWRNIELNQMLGNYRVEKGKRANYSLPYVPRIEFDSVELKIHPYFLGILIGDGGLTQRTIRVTTPDKEILDRISQMLPEGYAIKHLSRYDYMISQTNRSERHGFLHSALREYGLLGKHSYEKYIPRDYLYASYDDRWELLRGLLDSDGHAQNTYIEYATSSEQLASDVCELVHSLGGYCSINKKTNCGYKKDGVFHKCRDAYRLIIQFCKGCEDPFFLSRKKDVYNPKRTIWRRYIEDIQYIGDAETICIMIDDPCHLYVTDDYIITHNTTISKFFISGVIGWFPKEYNLFFSHSGDITRMYYDGTLQIVTDDEYTWKDIFPGLSVTNTNAKMGQFNIGSYKPFPSLQTASVGSENAGKVRASKFLLVDDLIGKLEEALNKNTLDKLWGVYSVDARQRKTQDTDNKPCKEIIIATRWSVHDPIGRIQRAYDGNDRVRSIAVPDIDPKTGESNFDYEYGGFTVAFFNDQALLMDDVSYRCLYKNDPIEREGLLYPEDSLRRYLEMPDREPDAILGICDTKGKGIDYLFLPCFYQYGEDYYLDACICNDNADYEIQYSRMVNLITENNMQQCEFESNRDGDRVAYEVSNRLKERGARCNITTKYSMQNKETKIIVNADWVKKHVLFKDKSLYTAQEDYGVMMNFLTNHPITGKVKNDDVPDGLASFALYITNQRPMIAQIVRNPFM